MSNVKISQLPIGIPTSTSVYPFVDGGETYQGTISAITRPYKVYTALLTQSGTSAPVATVLENTIGEITLSYQIPGRYSIDSSNLFEDGKTYTNQGGISNIFGAAVRFGKSSSSSVIITSSSGGPSPDGNSALLNFPIEIRVYN